MQKPLNMKGPAWWLIHEELRQENIMSIFILKLNSFPSGSIWHLYLEQSERGRGEGGRVSVYVISSVYLSPVILWNYGHRRILDHQI